MDTKRILFVILFTAITIAASSQKRDRHEIVLNDGTVFKGIIVTDSSDFIKVKIKRPQVITLNKTQVYSTGKIRGGMYGPGKKQGYSIRLSASLLTGQKDSENKANLSIHLSNGYQFKSGFGTGIGTGIEKLDVLVLPVYGDLRYQPFKTRLSPFLWLKSGYGFPVSNRDIAYYYGNYTESRGGFMFGAGTGLALYSWNRNAVNIGIGYRYQKLRFEQKNPWSQEIKNELITYFKRIEVQFGFIFR